MFKDVYKAANDDIKADEELLNSVLSAKRRTRPPVYKYSSIAAAAAVIAVSAASVPFIMQRGADTDAGQNAVVSSPVPVNMASVSGDAPEKSDEREISEVSDNAPAREPEKEVSPALKSESAESKNEKTVKAARADTAESAVKSDGASESAAMPDSDAQAESAGDTVPEAVPDSADNGADAGTVNTYTRSVVLHVNSEDYGGAAAESEYEEALYGGVYTAAEWSMDDYFAYLGVNVLDKLSLPADFAYIGSYEAAVSVDENNIPMQDSRIFPYEGSGGRYITVITSKNTLTARSYLEDERYVKSDINGVGAVVTGGSGDYKCYIIGNGVSYTVTALGVTEDELADLLISIGG